MRKERIASAEWEIGNLLGGRLWNEVLMKPEVDLRPKHGEYVTEAAALLTGLAKSIGFYVEEEDLGLAKRQCLHHRLLAVEEERFLGWGLEVEAMNAGAVDCFCRGNQRFIFWKAGKKAKGDDDLRWDLFGEGNVALLMAAKKYDWRREVRFVTYLGCWLDQAMNRFLTRVGSGMIAVPEGYVADNAPGVERVVEARMLLGSIEERLTDRQRQVWELYAEGWTCEAAGEVLGCSRQNVFNQIKRIRERARQLGIDGKER